MEEDVGATGGDGGLVQVSPSEIQSAGGLIGMAAEPLEVGASTVAGAQVAMPGFAMSDAANDFSASWSGALSGLAGQVGSAANTLRTTSSVYIDEEVSITNMFGG